MTFSDINVDVCESIGKVKVKSKRQELLILNGASNSNCCDSFSKSFDRTMPARSKSECLVCTGQAVDRLLDDPEFLDGLNNHSEESEEHLLPDESLYSKINYENYEYQE